MEVINGKQALPSRAQQSTPRLSLRENFPWFWAVLISVTILLSENYFPADVLVDENSTDLTASILQGNVVRQLGYPIIGLIGILFLTRSNGYRLSWRNPFVLSFVSFLTWCILSIIWAQEPGVAAKRLIAYLFMIICAAGLAAAWSRAEILKFVSLSGAAHLTIGLIGEILIGNFTPWSPGYRFAGTQTWNVQGFCCLLVVLSSLAASDADVRYKIWFRILAAYGLVFLVLTKSRSSMLGVAAGLLVYYSMTRSLTAKARAAAVVLVSTLLLYISGNADSTIAYLSRNGEQVEDLTGRVPMWELAMTYVTRRPLIGYGYHDFWTIKNVDYFSNEFHWTISAAHNSYLETLLTLGYVGMFLHVMILVFGIFRAVRLFRLVHSPIFALAAALCVVFLVVGFLEAAVLWSPSPYELGIIAILWSLCFDKAIRAASSSQASLDPGNAN
jgi:O-antigen ligase